MALRTQTQTTTTPDVEDSRAQLEFLEGQKKSTQDEMLGVAADKQRLESERSEIIKRLDAEILQKQKELKDIESAHQKVLAVHTKEKYDAELGSDTARKECTVIEQERDALKKEINALLAVKTGHSSSLAALRKQQSDVQYSVDLLKNEERQHKDRIEVLRRQRSSEEKLLAETEEKHANAKSAFNFEKDAHQSLTAGKAEKEKEIIRLTEVRSERQAEIRVFEATLGELEKQKTDRVAEVAEQDRSSNERLRNATLLEQKVDAKLAQLKEFESHFTTEHLARVGYKPIGT